MDVLVGNVVLRVPAGVAATQKAKKSAEGKESVWKLELSFENFTGTLEVKKVIERSVEGGVVGIVRAPAVTPAPPVAAPEAVVAKPPQPEEQRKEAVAASPAAIQKEPTPVASPPKEVMVEPEHKEVTPQVVAKRKSSKLSLSKPKKQLKMSDFGLRKDGLSLMTPMTTGAEHAYKKSAGVSWETVSGAEDASSGAMVARCGATAALDAETNKVYVCGGLGDDGYLDDLWILDTGSWTWTQGGSSGFRKRAWHTSSIVKDKILVFGGQCDKPEELKEDEDDDTMLLGELTMYDFESGVWFPAHATGEAPCARSGHSATPIGDNKLVIFGGMNEDGKFMNDVNVLDTSLFTWSKPKTKGSPIKPRGYHTAVMIGHKILFFGGIGKCNWAFKEIYSLDTKTWKWTEHSSHVQGEAPSTRVGQVVTALPDGKSLLVQGGHDAEDASTCFNDAYVLDTQKWSWVSLPAGENRPSPRAGHCGVAVNGVFATFFGQDATDSKMKDVWKLDLSLVASQ
ncbi:hypothetical protein HOP50_06g45560 [Chloropicon primus]|uniref:Galactose oxidase n=1 Tax=Chloropicon primus TaxID=1764295 RepID=A0A5B8MQW9_9CHLO|nr:hypothetical protein A3770_06p45330 [Chloropicon primus]UPR01235.1 hypothetical protein HOP50_06g45560 [Chloropicon primus]|eukprot:QDZ22015.1 hypothetical protein A3770_06p45330 [Chloropicon primus]